MLFHVLLFVVVESCNITPSTSIAENAALTEPPASNLILVNAPVNPLIALYSPSDAVGAAP